MPNEQNSIVIRPFADDHAIVQVSFGFEWDEPLSQEVLSRISEAHDAITQDFPVKRVVRQEISVDVTGDGERNAQQNPGGDGILMILMDRIEDKNNLIRQIVVEQKRLLLNDFGKYDNWDSVRDRVMAWLSPFLDVILGERTLRAVGLQYLDAFEVVSDAPVAPHVFVREDLLPHGIFGRLVPWHVNQGYTEPLVDPVACTMLTNLNIRLFRLDTEKQILEVRTSHRAHFDPEARCDRERLVDMQDRLHSENKALLRKILLPGIQQAIHLDQMEN